MELEFKKYILKFRFDAGTSRGVYKEKATWIIKISENDKIGYGECGPLVGLSPDLEGDLEDKLSQIKEEIKFHQLPDTDKGAFRLALQLSDYHYPALRFGLETALLDLIKGGKRVIFLNDFTVGNKKIPINGLIWMGNRDFMHQQANEKIGTYSCIKMKIGAIDFHEEKELIKSIRERDKNVILRLDANGAFSANEAIDKLNDLAQYGIHSVEQPIQSGNWEDMRKVAEASPIPVALDEELIGINYLEDKIDLLKSVQPSYIILKPSLHGGLSSCMEWINNADKLNIGWWITSALESNIGLNAISQFTAEVDASSYQGLGTGQLYENNFDSPLITKGGHVYYDIDEPWDINLFD